MPDSNLGPRWRHMARILRAEGALTVAARKALDSLTTYAARALPGAGYDVHQLSGEAAGWNTSLASLLGEVEAVFMTAWGRAERGTIDPGPYATRHLESVQNRLARIPDEVFDTIRTELVLGREAQESIPQLAARVDGLLGDSERWANRATLIARTEVMAANGSGSNGSARAAALYLEVDESLVAKTWLATNDGRTRETHAEADGQVVYGLSTPFIVGGAELEYACDSNGPAAEVIQCRCTTLYSYPGDPDYPTGLDVSSSEPGETPLDAAVAIAAAATPQEDDMAEDNETRTGVVVVAIPSAGDPVYGIGPEDKHATLLYFGDVEGGDNPNALLTDEFRTALSSAIAQVAAGEVPEGVESVEGVESLGDDGAQVWMLGGDFLPGLRGDLLSAGDGIQAVLDAVEQFPSFRPHVTIGYPDEGLTDEDVAAAVAVESITFDRLALWWAGEQTEWPLAGPEPEEAPVETDTEQVAASASLLMSNDTVTAAAGDPAPVPPAQTLDAGEPAPTVNPEGELGQPGPEDDDRFYGVMVVEDSQTGDGRVFAPGSIGWDNTPLPIPLGWQVADAMGHDGSVVCGRIDTIERYGNLIGYTGTWDTEGAGYETRRLVEGQFLTGLSVDTDDFDAIVVDADGNPLDPMAMMFEGDMTDPILLVQSSRIRSAAMCRVPAFVEAFVANGTPPAGWSGERPGAVAPGEEPVEVVVEVTDEVVVEELVASAVRAGNPPAQVPSLLDYSNPNLEGPTPITVTDDGRVYGHIATWGVCHIGYDGTCVTPPHSLTGYAHFLKGEVETDGGIVPVGRVTMETGHADGSLSAGAAAAHYDNTGSAVANVTCGEDEHGIWFSGRLLERTTPVQIAELRAAGAVSGDWRRIGGNLELVATLACNVPGFPIPRLAIAASGERQLSLVASGVVTPDNAAADRGAPFSMDEVARHAVAIIDRRTRAHAAQARLRVHREAKAAHLLERFQQDRKNRVAAAAARLGRE